ncbi:MAG: DUF559 domain-containing protein [Ilumatobacteraceae bacterium]
MGTELDLITRAAAQHFLVGSADRAAIGFSDWRWDRAQELGLWVQVAPGRFRHVATPLTFDMAVRAGSAWLGRSGALFGTTALRWLGVEVPEPSQAEFLVPRARRSVPNWAVIHTTTRWDDRDIINHLGVRTCSATRALIDYATQRPSAEALEQAIDSSIRLRRTAFGRLTSRLSTLRGTGRAGVALMSELLLDAGGDSHLERRFLRLVRTANLPRPDCQIVIRSNGRRVARVDFVFPSTNVIVEVSGRLGHVSDRDRQRDARRRNRLQQMGNIVLEFTTADVIDGHAYVLDTLAAALRPSSEPCGPTSSQSHVSRP